MNASKSISVQKFALESKVVKKDAKPWFSLDPSKVLTGEGTVKDYGPDVGYWVEVQGERFWYSEDALESAEKTSFDVEAFMKGQKAITRSGCTARFLQVNKDNLTYKIKAEVTCKDSTTIQDYSESGLLTQGLMNRLDLVGMLGVTDKKGETVMKVEDNKADIIYGRRIGTIGKQQLKGLVMKEIKEVQSPEHVKYSDKTAIEKELELAIASEAMVVEVKSDAERYEWLAKYMTSGVQIDFVDLQLKLATNKAELDATIDKLKGSIKFK